MHGKVENAGKVTVQGLVQLSELGKERAAGKDGLLAIVVAKPLIDTMARIYATSIAESKKDIRIFYHVKEALSWLEFDGQEVDKLTRWINRRRL